MSNKFVIWDPNSHEHLTFYDRKNPVDSHWEFLDTNQFDEKNIQLFPSELAAQRAAKAILAEEGEEDKQLEVRAVSKVIRETGQRKRVEL